MVGRVVLAGAAAEADLLGRHTKQVPRRVVRFLRQLPAATMRRTPRSHRQSYTLACTSCHGTLPGARAILLSGVEAPAVLDRSGC
jgi:hypothetical protein